MKKNNVDQIKLNMLKTGEYVRAMSRFMGEMVADLELLPWDKADRREKLYQLETLARVLLMQHLVRSGRVILNSRFDELRSKFESDNHIADIHASHPFEDFFGPYVDTGTIIGKGDEPQQEPPEPGMIKSTTVADTLGVPHDVIMQRIEELKKVLPPDVFNKMFKGSFDPNSPFRGA